MSHIIKNIAFPIKNANIVTCSRLFCLCVEYLDFGIKNDVERYKQCMITNLKNNNVPPSSNTLLKRSRCFSNSSHD